MFGERGQGEGCRGQVPGPSQPATGPQAEASGLGASHGGGSGRNRLEGGCHCKMFVEYIPCPYYSTETKLTRGF